MRILIMVQACEKPPYDMLHTGQVATWDSIDVKGIDTMYYWCDVYNLMHIPFRDALKNIDFTKYDFVFRTNASSYIHKKALIEKASHLPKRGCYCGIDGGGFASGSGFFISTDLLQYLVDGLKDDPHGSEDVYIGQVLQEHGIKVTPGAERFDFNHQNDKLRPTYHYRCKSDTGDRNKDIEAFKQVHKFLHG